MSTLKKDLPKTIEDRRSGKKKAKISDYRAKCHAKLVELDAQMELIGNKKDAEWKKLRKQRIAYQARLRNRFNEHSTLEKITQVTDVTKMVLQMALALLPDSQKT